MAASWKELPPEHQTILRTRYITEAYRTLGEAAEAFQITVRSLQTVSKTEGWVKARSEYRREALTTLRFQAHQTRQMSLNRVFGVLDRNLGMLEQRAAAAFQANDLQAGMSLMGQVAMLRQELQLADKLLPEDPTMREQEADGGLGGPTTAVMLSTHETGAMKELLGTVGDVLMRGYTDTRQKELHEDSDVIDVPYEDGPDSPPVPGPATTPG